MRAKLFFQRGHLFMGKKPKEHKRIAWSAVKPKPITFLWDGWLPFGKISLLVGDSGLGKTTIAIDLAARLTSGRPMPLSKSQAITGNVLFQSLEDDLADTLLPRCINAGADLSRIESIDCDGLNIDEDCEIIEQHIKETNAKIIIFDPLQQYMGKCADMSRITDIRRLVTNLGGIAARNDCVCLVIAHQNKSQGANELHRVFGSVDITATARSVIRISKSENDPETRIISHIKSSVSRPAAPIAFRIEGDSQVVYLGEYDGEGDFDEIPDDKSKRAKAVEIIYSMLQEGPMEGTEIFKVCNEAGISTRTVERVKKELNVRSGRDGSKHIWFLE
jgi:archaellum biogenesis ATPase FlaH